MGIKQEIVEYIKKLDYVSFAELTNMLETRNVETHGSHALCHPTHDNVVFWPGLSQLLCNVMIELIHNRRIKVQQCKPLIYAIDGKMINMPIAKSIRGYEKPHWLPVVLRVVKEEFGHGKQS